MALVYDDAMHLDAVGWIDSRLIIIYHNDVDYKKSGFFRSFFAGPRYFKHVYDKSNGNSNETRIRSIEAYCNSDKFTEQSVKYLERYLGHVKLHQLTSSELAAMTSRQVNIVDTDKSNGFLEATDSYINIDFPGGRRCHFELPKETLLRWQAHLLGADALVHYQAASPARATPVKFKDNEMQK